VEEVYTDKIISLSIDDMEIAPDFFDYFEAAAALLDKDKYCLLGELNLFYVVYHFIRIILPNSGSSDFSLVFDIEPC
jgi:hypothetical protein